MWYLRGNVRDSAQQMKVNNTQTVKSRNTRPDKRSRDKDLHCLHVASDARQTAKFHFIGHKPLLV